jgi:hypothetical protein
VNPKNLSTSFLFLVLVQPKKCEPFQKEVEFLGRVVGPRGIYIGPGYIKDIKNWPRPKNKKEVERFFGVHQLP